MLCAVYSSPQDESNTVSCGHEETLKTQLKKEHTEAMAPKGGKKAAKRVAPRRARRRAGAKKAAKKR
jgi:hypothetical protein